MKISIIFAVFLAMAFEVFEGKKFEKCELVKELSGIFPRYQLQNWNCLAWYESRYDSQAKGQKNKKDGSYDWGIFQINDKYWCKDGSKGGDCNIDCNDLVDDDITDDIKCAEKIYERHRFYAWVAWKDYCQYRSLPKVAQCL